MCGCGARLFSQRREVSQTPVTNNYIYRSGIYFIVMSVTFSSLSKFEHPVLGPITVVASRFVGSCDTHPWRRSAAQQGFPERPGAARVLSWNSRKHLEIMRGIYLSQCDKTLSLHHTISTCRGSEVNAKARLFNIEIYLPVDGV